MGRRPEQRRQAPIAQDQIMQGSDVCPRCGTTKAHYGSCSGCSYRTDGRGWGGVQVPTSHPPVVPVQYG